MQFSFYLVSVWLRDLIAIVVWLFVSANHCYEIKKNISLSSKSHWNMERTTGVLRVPFLATYIWQVLVRVMSSKSYFPKSQCDNKK